MNPVFIISIENIHPMIVFQQLSIQIINEGLSSVVYKNIFTYSTFGRNF